MQVLEFVVFAWFINLSNTNFIKRNPHIIGVLWYDSRFMRGKLR
ncbi:hypothetical protein [Moraxella caviae]|nr:hypothetical protein [Moraxella caviae]